MKIFKFSQVLPQLPNLLFRSRLKFRFELLPFEARRIGWKKKWNFVVAGLNQFFLPARPFGHPVIAQVEPTNMCNLSCPLCVSATHNGSRPEAMLSLETFRRFIDEVGDCLLLLILWNWGEPFLHPQICDMIAYASRRGILVHSSTNGNVVFSAEKAEQIVASGLSSLIFAIDGATPETYSRYRQGGRLDKVQENIRSVVRARKKLGSRLPLITVRFVVMRQNESELPLVEEMARNLGADFFVIKSVDLPKTTGVELDQRFRPENEKYRRYEYVPDSYIRKARAFTCMRPWKRITLDAQGVIISCEMDFRNSHPFARLDGRSSALSGWKSPAAAAFRRRFRLGNNDAVHCRTCTYKGMVNEQCNLEARKLGPRAEQGE